MKFPKIKPAFPLPKFPRSNKYNKQVGDDDEQHESISVDYFVDAGQYSMGSIESIECTAANDTNTNVATGQQTRGLVLDSITESEEEGKEDNMELQMKASYDSYVQQWNNINNIKSEESVDNNNNNNNNNNNEDTTINPNPNDNTSYDHALRQDTSQDSVSILKDLERIHTSTKKNSRGSNAGISAGRYKPDRTSLDSCFLTKEEREVAEQELTTQMLHDSTTSTYDASTITTQQQQHHSQPIPLRRHSRGSNNNTRALQSVKESSHQLPKEHSTLHDFVEDMDAQLEEEIASFNNVSKTSSKSVRLSGVSIGDQDGGLEITRSIERVPTDEKNPPQEHSYEEFMNLALAETLESAAEQCFQTEKESGQGSSKPESSYQQQVCDENSDKENKSPMKLNSQHRNRPSSRASTLSIMTSVKSIMNKSNKGSIDSDDTDKENSSITSQIRGKPSHTPCKKKKTRGSLASIMSKTNISKRYPPPQNGSVYIEFGDSEETSKKEMKSQTNNNTTGSISRASWGKQTYEKPPKSISSRVSKSIARPVSKSRGGSRANTTIITQPYNGSYELENDERNEPANINRSYQKEAEAALLAAKTGRLVPINGSGSRSVSFNPATKVGHGNKGLPQRSRSESPFHQEAYAALAAAEEAKTTSSIPDKRKQSVRASSRSNRLSCANLASVWVPNEACKSTGQFPKHISVLSPSSTNNDEDLKAQYSSFGSSLSLSEEEYEINNMNTKSFDQHFANAVEDCDEEKRLPDGGVIMGAAALGAANNADRRVTKSSTNKNSTKPKTSSADSKGSNSNDSKNKKKFRRRVATALGIGATAGIAAAVHSKDEDEDSTGEEVYRKNSGEKISEGANVPSHAVGRSRKTTARGTRSGATLTASRQSAKPLSNESEKVRSRAASSQPSAPPPGEASESASGVPTAPYPPLPASTNASATTTVVSVKSQAPSQPQQLRQPKIDHAQLIQNMMPYIINYGQPPRPDQLPIYRGPPPIQQYYPGPQQYYPPPTYHQQSMNGQPQVYYFRQ